eukprot:Skav231760  [mRNA]  locus=scaffold695:135655:143475:- [translate_table: standard]
MADEDEVNATSPLPEEDDVNLDQDPPMEEDKDDKEPDVEHGDVQQLEDQMRMLNGNGALSKDLDVDQLLEPLTHVGTSQALEILTHLEEKGSEVKDPTAWVMKAVRTIRKGGPRQV